MNYDHWDNRDIKYLQILGRCGGIKYIIDDFTIRNWSEGKDLKVWLELECSDFVLAIMDMYNITIEDIENLLVLI